MVLCGHSYGGAVVSGVADRVPDRIGALVYLDAFLLDNGRSVHDEVPPGQRNMQLEGVRVHGDGWKVPTIPAAAFNLNARDAASVDRQCTMQPLAAFQEPLQLSGKMDAVEDITFVLATGYEGSPFMPFYERAKTKGWKTLSVACGHDVMLDMPQKLTTILLNAAPRGASLGRLIIVRVSLNLNGNEQGGGEEHLRGVREARS